MRILIHHIGKWGTERVPSCSFPFALDTALYYREGRLQGRTNSIKPPAASSPWLTLLDLPQWIPPKPVSESGLSARRELGVLRVTSSNSPVIGMQMHSFSIQEQSFWLLRNQRKLPFASGFSLWCGLYNSLDTELGTRRMSRAIFFSKTQWLLMLSKRKTLY